MNQKREPSSASRKSSPAPPARWLIWTFRFSLAIIVPLLVLAVAEGCLRLAGAGYPSDFLLKSSNHGEKTYIQNNQFGWRFFGRTMARLPYPLSLAQEKPPGTIRIFVFGESAAYGDPQPAFGLSRMLQAILSARHPGAKFEVINTAMTGINSHTVLPIARDCTRAHGDIWVIYMGNNEVVGPFGSGTVFGPQTPPLPLIRASLALKTTRIGQVLDALRPWSHSAGAGTGEWGGMMMFLHQQVRADDPRMKKVYGNFQKNLADIIQAGRDSGAGIVLSTVGVNLADCAPFSSLHRENLSAAQKADWDAAYNSGLNAQAAGELADALAQFKVAEKIDPAYAELRFREGRCALALGDEAEARQQLQSARDYDTLRFRCDTKLNDLIRRAATNAAPSQVLLADAEQAFAAQSPRGVPGEQFFYEHVHLTFEGNYLLAHTIAEQVEKLLSKKITAESAPWPDRGTCALRLAWTDLDFQSALSEVLSRLTDPPFTLQANHRERQAALAARARSLAGGSQATRSLALKVCTQAIALSPEDATLYQQLSRLKQAAGDLPGAEAAARRALELLPSSLEAQTQLGLILVQQQKYENALATFRHASALDSQDVWSLQNIAVTLGKLNRRDEAIREFHRALALKPKFGLAWLGLGQLLEAAGHKDKAENCFRQALTNRIHRADELTTLARFCQSRGWFEAAATNYADAIELSPADAKLRFESGQTLAALGRHAEAARRFSEAAKLAPDWVQAHFLDGLELGRLNQPAAAEQEFREAIRLMPGLTEAHLNLGIALTSQKKYDEAVAEFQSVLRLSPDNPAALKYLKKFKEN